MSRRWAAIVLAMLLLASAQAHAQSYPSKTVRMIVPAAPGGNPDVLARVLAQKLTEAFGKPFVIENVPGAGGVAAAEQVVKAAPDGHTLLLGDSGAMAINIAMKNTVISYDPLRDFTPITALMTVPTVLVINPAVPANTLQEFVALAKAEPGRLSYGSAGTGSIHHLTMAVFAARAGLNVLHVPYRGGTALVAATLSGEVQAGWSGIPNVLEPIRAGSLRVLAISTDTRAASLPDVPTVGELGYPGFNLATMIGLVAPAGVPAEIVARLQQAVAKALREPDVVQRMQTLGMNRIEDGTEHYARLMRSDIQLYVEAVKTAGVKND